MRIGIDASRATRPQPTGTESYSWHLLHELPGLESGHQFVYYFNSPPPPGFQAHPAVTHRVIPFPRLWTHGRLAWEMLTRPPELLFVPAHVLPIVHPRRTVVTVHDLGYVHYPDAYPLSRRWYLHLGTRYSARCATLVIADSEATRRDLVQRYDIPEGKIRVVPLAADPAFRPDIEPARIAAVKDRYGLGRPYFIFVGSVHPRKNLLRLLDAFRMLGQGELVIAGRLDWRADEVRRRAEGLPVRFLGYVPAGDLPSLVAGALALVLPSFYEGFGLPALEAMACGTPVVAANSSSLPEVVGDAGLLVAPDRPEEMAVALGRLYGDPVLREELRRRGLEQARRFSWRRCARETLAVLEEALGQS